MTDWKAAISSALFTAGSLAKEGLIKTKDLAVAGIEKVQDPEFQQSVKNGASTVVDMGKKVLDPHAGWRLRLRESNRPRNPHRCQERSSLRI